MELAAVCEVDSPEVEGFKGGFWGVKLVCEAGILLVHVELLLELREDGLEEHLVSVVGDGLANLVVLKCKSSPVRRDICQGSALQTSFVEAAK